MAERKPERTGASAGAIVGRLAASLVVLGGVYTGAAYLLSQRAPADMTISGVAIGGLGHEEAASKLRAKLAPLTAKDVVLTAGGKQATLDPQAAGLALDVDGTLDGLTSFSLNPSDVLAHLTGGGSRKVDTTVDRTKLAAAVAASAKQLDVAPKDATLSIATGQVVATDAVKGVTVDAGRTADAVADQWPADGPIAASSQVKDPAVTQDALDKAVSGDAKAILAGPVTVTDGKAKGQLSPAQLGAVTTFPAKDGALVATLDPTKLAESVRRVAPALEAKPVNATVKLVNDKPTPVAGKPGTTIDPKDLVSSVLGAAHDGARTATVKTTVAQPEFSLEDVKKWGIKEVIATYDADLPYNPPRTTNIRIAANTINGTVIPPGGTFSLNGILGERTPEKGYQDAIVIMDGRYEKGTGGGVSQVSTSVLNAAFFAGMKLTEHHAHAFYITHYPEGREATVHWDDLDNKWTNDTPYGVLVQSSVESGVLKFAMWSTKSWDDIKALKSPRRAIRAPKVIYDTSAGCVPQVPVPGFSVTITRQFIKGGAVAKTDGFTTSYIPQDDVNCHAKPVPKATPAPATPAPKPSSATSKPATPAPTPKPAATPAPAAKPATPAPAPKPAAKP